jgi:Protein of unknown function (DUF1769)
MSAGAPSSTSSTSSTPPDEPSTSTTKNKYAQKYSLRVTAGISYDTASHVVVPVNAPQTLHLNSQHMLLSVAVRIKNFTGVPTSSPPTSPYFDHSLHRSDQYSIAFSFIPKTDIQGNDLVFGNDFDRPIRDRLPPGFNQAFRIAKWFVDPGLEGDPYSDKPYLYGPALSSWNILRIGEKIFEPEKPTQNEDAIVTEQPQSDSAPPEDPEAWQMPNAESFHATVVEEGAEGSGSEIRSSLSIPPDSNGRKKHFLTESNRENFTFEAGRLHQSDFGNPYLDFNDFSLKLPGFSLNVIKYVDEKTHELRYVLKNRTTDDVYAVVLLSLLFGDERDEVAQKDQPPPREAEQGADDNPKAETKDTSKRPEGDFGYEKPPAEDDVD